MLFFRSEEAIDLWCEGRGVARGAVADLDQLWKLALAWYADRLAPNAERPRPNQIRKILDRVGLTDSAWDPQADAPRVGRS